MTAPVFLTGFEGGTISASGGGLANLINGTPFPQGTVVHSGSYALECDAPTTTSVNCSWSGAATSYTNVGRFYFQAHNIAGTVTVASVTDSFIIRIDSTDNKLFLVNGLTTYAKGDAVTEDAWHYIDFYINSSANPHTIDWKIDGVAQAQQTYANGANLLAWMLNLGFQTLGTGILYFDDIVLSQAAADYPIGPGGTKLHTSQANGTHNTSAGIMQDNLGADISGGVSVYPLLNSIPAGNIATYLQQAGAGTASYAEVQYLPTSNPTRSGIIGTEGVLAYKSASATTNNGGCIVTIDDFSTTTTIWGAPGALADYSENSVFYKSAIIVGGTADSQTIKTRMGYASDANPDPYWIDCYFEVAYTVSTNPTGTANIVESADSVSASGSSGMTGTSNLTEAADSVTAAAAVAVRGISTLSESADALSTSGSVGGAPISGNSSLTESADTIAAAGAVRVAGSAESAESADTVSATGASQVTGSAALTESADALTSAVASSNTGIAAITESADSLSAFAAVRIAASAALTETNDTLITSGTVGSVVWIGNAALVESADAVSASGTSAVAGVAPVVESADTISTGSAVAVAGSSSNTESADTLASSGAVGSLPITGSAAILEIADVVSSIALVAAAATASITESSDSLVTAASISVQANVTVNEDADTVAGIGSVGAGIPVIGTAALVEIADTASIAGSSSIAGSATLSELPDALVTAGTVTTIIHYATVDVAESSDAISAVSVSSITGIAAPMELADSVSSTGNIPVFGTSVLTELEDALVGVGGQLICYYPTAHIVRPSRSAVESGHRRSVLSSRQAVSSGPRKDVDVSRNDTETDVTQR